MRTIPTNNISCEKLNGSIVSVATSNSLPLIIYGTTRAVKASGSMKRNKTQNYNLRILCFFSTKATTQRKRVRAHYCRVAAKRGRMQDTQTNAVTAGTRHPTKGNPGQDGITS